MSIREINFNDVFINAFYEEIKDHSLESLAAIRTEEIYKYTAIIRRVGELTGEAGNIIQDIKIRIIEDINTSEIHRIKNII